MIRMEWVRGVTAGELAEQWGLAQSTVEGDAADAGHLLDLYQQPEHVKVLCMTHLHRVIEESGRDRVRAMRLALQATGNLTDHIDVTVSTRTTPDMYAAALEHPGFREYLIAQGWRPPAAALLTEGSEIRT